MKRQGFEDFLGPMVTDTEIQSALESDDIRQGQDAPEWIRNYELREIEESREHCLRAEGTSELDILDFFPDLDVSGPYCDRLPGVPTWTLLPFFEHVLVWIEPHQSEDTFESIYGLPPDRFADLCGPPENPGKIVPLLNASPSAFADLPHYERILELEPPTMWRDFFFQRALAGPETFDATRDLALEVLPSDMPDSERYASLRDTDRGTPQEFAVSCFSSISCFGGKDLAVEIVQRAETAEQLLDLLFYYSLTLYDSYVSPLGGTYPVIKEDLDQLTRDISELANRQPEEFPLEIGKSIIDRMDFPLPTTESAARWWATEGRDVWEPARNALDALEDEIHSTSSNAVDEARRLDEIWSAAAEEVRTQNRINENVKWTLAGLGVIGSVAGMATVGLPGLIASVLGTTASFADLFDIGSVYSRISRPRHLTTVVGLHQYLSDHPHMSP